MKPVVAFAITLWLAAAQADDGVRRPVADTPVRRQLAFTPQTRPGLPIVTDVGTGSISIGPEQMISCSIAGGDESPIQGDRLVTVNGSKATVEAIVCQSSMVVIEASTTGAQRVWAPTTSTTQRPLRHISPPRSQWQAPFDPTNPTFRVVVPLGMSVSEIVAGSLAGLDAGLVDLEPEVLGALRHDKMNILVRQDLTAFIARVNEFSSALLLSGGVCSNPSRRRRLDISQSLSGPCSSATSSTQVAVALDMPLVRPGSAHTMHSLFVEKPASQAAGGAAAAIRVSTTGVSIGNAPASAPGAPLLSVSGVFAPDQTDRTAVTTTVGYDVVPSSARFGDDGPASQAQAEEALTYPDLVQATVPLRLPSSVSTLPVMCVIPEISLDGRLFDACRRPGYNASAGYADMLASGNQAPGGLALDGGDGAQTFWQSFKIASARSPVRLADLNGMPDLGRLAAGPTSAYDWQNATSSRLAPASYSGTAIAAAHGSQHLGQFVSLTQPSSLPTDPGTVESENGNILATLPGARWSWQQLACFRPASLTGRQLSHSVKLEGEFGQEWEAYEDWEGASSAYSPPLSPSASLNNSEYASLARGVPLHTASHSVAFQGRDGSAASLGRLSLAPGSDQLDQVDSVEWAKWLRADPTMLSRSHPSNNDAAAGASDAVESWSKGGDVQDLVRQVLKRGSDLESAALVHIPLLLEPASIYRVRFRTLSLQLEPRLVNVDNSGWFCNCSLAVTGPAVCPSAPSSLSQTECAGAGGVWTAPSQVWSMRVRRSVVSDASDSALLITPAVKPPSPVPPVAATVTAHTIEVLPLPPPQHGGCPLDTLEVTSERQALPAGSAGGASLFDADNEASWGGPGSSRPGIQWLERPEWRDQWLFASLLNDTSTGPTVNPLPAPPSIAASTSPFFSDLERSSTLTLRRQKGTWPLVLRDGDASAGGGEPLQRFTHYRYTSRAHSPMGWSRPSRYLVVQSAPTPPDAPRNLTFVPEWHTPVQLGIRFRPPADSGGPFIQRYFRALVANGTVQPVLHSLTVRSATPELKAGWPSANTSDLWFTSNITNLAWSTRYDVSVVASTFLTGYRTPKISVVTDPPAVCALGCVRSLGQCHPWNGVCQCAQGWFGEDCSSPEGEVLVLKLSVGAKSLATTGAVKLSETDYPDIDLATSAAGADFRIGTPHEKQAVLDEVFGGGKPIALPSLATLAVSQQLGVAAGADESMWHRVRILSTRLTSADALLAATSNDDNGATGDEDTVGTLTVVLSVLPLSSLTPSELLQVTPASRGSAPVVAQGVVTAARAMVSPVMGMGVTQVARVAGLGSAAVAEVVVVAPASCASTVAAALDPPCTSCVEDRACGYCPTTDTCAPGTGIGFAIGSPECPGIQRPLGVSGTGPSDLIEASLARYFHKQAQNNPPSSSTTCFPKCSTLDSCDECTVRADCRFCRQSQTCSSLDELGLIETQRVGNGVCPFSFIADDKQICPSRRCKLRSGTTRAHCVADTMCGWCTTEIVPPGHVGPASGTGECSAGDAFGPAESEVCTGSWFFRTAVSCIDIGAASLTLRDDDEPTTHVTSSAIVCGACVGQSLPCGFCNSTGTCVTSSEDGGSPALGTCSSGWVGPSGLSGVCPAKPLSRRELCELQNECGGCLGLSFCSWCDLGAEASGSCKYDPLKETNSVAQYGSSADQASLSCYAVTPIAQFLRSTCLFDCTSPVRLQIMTGSVTMGSAHTYAAPTPSETDRQLTSSINQTPNLRALAVSNSTGLDSSIMSGYYPTASCTWVIDPRPLTARLRSVSATASTSSSSGSSSVEYEPSTLPLVHLVMEAVDLGVGDKLYIIEGASADGVLIATVQGSSLPGAAGRGNPMAVKWSSGFQASTVETQPNAPVGGLFVASTSAGAVTLLLQGRLSAAQTAAAADTDTGVQQAQSQASSQARELTGVTLHRSTTGETAVTPIGQGGAGENTLPLGFKASFTAEEQRDVDLYLVVIAGVLCGSALCFAMYAARRFQKRARRRRQRRLGFEVYAEDETMAEAADRARNEGSCVPTSILKVQPAFVFEKAVLSQTPLKDLPDADMACPVSLEDFTDGETIVRVLPCSHAFAQPAVDAWLKMHRTCPMCKADVVEGHAARLSKIEAGEPDPLATGPDVKMRSASIDEAPSDARVRRMSVSQETRLAAIAAGITDLPAFDIDDEEEGYDDEEYDDQEEEEEEEDGDDHGGAGEFDEGSHSEDESDAESVRQDFEQQHVDASSIAGSDTGSDFSRDSASLMPATSGRAPLEAELRLPGHSSASRPASGLAVLRGGGRRGRRVQGAGDTSSLTSAQSALHSSTGATGAPPVALQASGTGPGGRGRGGGPGTPPRAIGAGSGSMVSSPLASASAVGASVGATGSSNTIQNPMAGLGGLTRRRHGSDASQSSSTGTGGPVDTSLLFSRNPLARQATAASAPNPLLRAAATGRDSSAVPPPPPPPPPMDTVGATTSATRSNRRA